MHSHSIDEYRHGHVFLGEAHERNERKTWGVIALCAAMMVAEIFADTGSARSRSSPTASTCPRMPARC